jgi:hypothetical protein
MLFRSLATIAALTLALTLPAASAHASDPLLSGYGGPGAGEQVVVGGTLKGSHPSSSAQDPESASLKAEPGSAASSSGTAASGGAGSALTRTPQRKKSPSSSVNDTSDGHDQDTAKDLPGAPEVVAYPTRADDAGGALSASALLLIVLGVAVATLVGLGLRRLAGSDRGSDPQVSAR